MGSNRLPFKVISGREWGYLLPEGDNWVVIRFKNGLRDAPDDSKERITLYDGKVVVFVSSHPTKGAADKALRKLSKSFTSSANIQQLPKEASYQLSLNERQARLLVNALDFYSRIGMGQIEEVSNILRINGGSIEKIEAVRNCLRAAADSWMGRAGGYNGIFSDKIHDVFRVAWDIQQVVRHRLAWDRTPEGGIQVDFDPPLKSSTEPLPIITNIES